MATTIPDLWPEDIKVEVLPPIAILKVQEELLARKTKGLLQAKVSTVETDKLVQHQLDLIAPNLHFYRERILSAMHEREMLYPVSVTADVLARRPAEPLAELGTALARAIAPLAPQRAATDDEFIRLVREILRSENVRALIASLLARINAKVEPTTNGPAHHDEKEAG
jgi:hypothetical protein